MDKYFEALELGDGIFHIYEPSGVYMTLIIGEEKTLLIDTGYGFGDLAAFVRKLTDKPLEVVLTHGHTDHSGGNFLFPEVYMNPVDIPVYHHYDRTQKPLYIEKFKRDQAKKGLPDAWPRGTDLNKWLVYHDREFEALTDGQIFDLGGRREEIIFMPGHTAGSVMIFDHRTGLLFSGDNISDSLWIFFDHSAPLSFYTGQLRNITQRPISGVISSHRGQVFSPVIMDDLLRTIGCINPETDKVFTHPRTGQKALRHREFCTAAKNIEFVYVVYDRNKL